MKLFRECVNGRSHGKNIRKRQHNKFQSLRSVLGQCLTAIDEHRIQKQNALKSESICCRCQQCGETEQRLECGVFLHAVMRQNCVHAYFTFEKNTPSRGWFSYVNSILCFHEFQIRTHTHTWNETDFIEALANEKQPHLQQHLSKFCLAREEKKRDNRKKLNTFMNPFKLTQMWYVFGFIFSFPHTVFYFKSR